MMIHGEQAMGTSAPYGTICMVACMVTQVMMTIPSWFYVVEGHNIH